MHTQDVDEDDAAALIESCDDEDDYPTGTGRVQHVQLAVHSERTSWALSELLLYE
jgi:hypothetical protein